MEGSNVEGVKRRLLDGVTWGRSFPEYVFRSRDFRHVYFFESPVAEDGPVLNQLQTVLRSIGATGHISIGHDYRDGQHLEPDDRGAVLDLAAPIDGPEASGFFEYVNSHPYTGITIGGDSRGTWALYDSPADDIGVIASVKPLPVVQNGAVDLIPLDRVAAVFGEGVSRWPAKVTAEILRNYDLTGE